MTGKGPTNRRRIRNVTMVTALAGPGPVAGGVWEVVANQAQSLRQVGLSVQIVAGWLGSHPPREIRGLPVSLIPLRQLVPGLGLRALVGRGWNAAVTEALSGADVAHIHLCRDLLTTFTPRAAHREGIPVIAQTHGMLAPSHSLLFKAFDVALTRPAMHRVVRFITLTDDEIPALKGFGVPAEHITTVQNAVPDPGVTWQPTTRPRLLFASRLHPRKQVLAFAEAVARLRRDGHDVEGVVAGPDHGDLGRLKQFIQAGNHGRYLSYLGELGRDRLNAELASATVFVFPARDEPFGLVLVEALSVGTPTVTTDQTPLAQTLRASGAAAVCAPEPELLAAEIGRVLADTTFRTRLSEQGRALYEQRWTTSAMTDRLLDVYEMALTDASGGLA